MSEFKPSHDEGRCFWLDWLRFGAAFLVVIYHARGSFFAEYGAFPADQRGLGMAVFFAVTRVGPEAVLLFFALSGYLVAGKAIVGRLMTGTFDLGRYAVDRATRIYVPLVPALVLTAAAGWVMGRPMSILEFAGNLAGLQDSWIAKPAANEALWSLGYEIWFYVMGGAAVMAIRASRSALKLLGWTLLGLGMAVFTRLDLLLLMVWVLGALAFVYQPTASGRVERAAASLLLIAGLLAYQVDRGSTSINSTWLLPFVPSHRLGTLLIGLGAALGLSAVAGWQPKSNWLRRLEQAGAPWAAFSYTLYLVHSPLLVLCAKLFGGERVAVASWRTFGLFAVEMAVCVLGAWLCYQMFERHTVRVRVWLSRLMLGGRPTEVCAN